MKLSDFVFWAAISIFFAWVVLAKTNQEITTYEFLTLIFLNILTAIVKRMQETEAMKRK